MGKLYEMASAMTQQVLLHDMKSIIYTTHDCGYIQRNPQESLQKPHDDKVAQVTVYVVMYTVFSTYLYCLLQV